MRKLMIVLFLACFVFCQSLMAQAAEKTGSTATVLTNEEVRSLVMEELKQSRKVAFFPSAYAKEGFDQFYIAFHNLAKKMRNPGIVAADITAVRDLQTKREKLQQINGNPESTVWYIWGKQMASEQMTGEGWDVSYDNEGFRPFLNPYVLPDQSNVKGNVIVIAGGSQTHRTNQLEGYPVAEYFNSIGYNAFVLQRRVLPYTEIDSVLDLVRSIRYIRYNAEKLGLKATDKIITCGFSAGGIHIMTALAKQYGTITPNSVYADYIPDEIDKVDANYPVALLIYGAALSTMGNEPLNLVANPKLPAMFIVAGENDTAFWKNSLDVAALLRGVVDMEVYLVPHAPHGFGMGIGLKGYADYYEAAENWPRLAKEFLDLELGYLPKTTHK